LTVAKIHPKNPPHTVYLANKEQGKLKIYKPNSEEVKGATSRSQNGTSVKPFLFTSYTLAKSHAHTCAGVTTPYEYALNIAHLIEISRRENEQSQGLLASPLLAQLAHIALRYSLHLAHARVG
jgi:hypothetical protein